MIFVVVVVLSAAASQAARGVRARAAAGKARFVARGRAGGSRVPGALPPFAACASVAGPLPPSVRPSLPPSRSGVANAPTLFSCVSNLRWYGGARPLGAQGEIQGAGAAGAAID